MFFGAVRVLGTIGTVLGDFPHSSTFFPGSNLTSAKGVLEFAQRLLSDPTRRSAPVFGVKRSAKLLLAALPSGYRHSQPRCVSRAWRLSLGRAAAGSRQMVGMASILFGLAAAGTRDVGSFAGGGGNRVGRELAPFTPGVIH